MSACMHVCVYVYVYVYVYAYVHNRVSIVDYTILYVLGMCTLYIYIYIHVVCYTVITKCYYVLVHYYSL